MHHVKEWEAKSQTIEEELDAVIDVHTFYGTWGETFKETRELSNMLQSIRHKIPKENTIHHFLDNFATAQNDATVHIKDIWQTLQDNKAHVLTEVESLKRAWRQTAIETLPLLKTRIEEGESSGLLTAEEFTPFETALQDMASEIDEESDLVKIALLPDRIMGRVEEHIGRLEQLLKSKDAGGDSSKQIKKIKLIPSPRRIKTLAEWNGLKNDLDAQINAALDQGDEVELS